MQISEVEITPVKPKNGLIAFASCVIDGWLYLGSIGVMTKLSGGYRLTFPTKKVGATDFNLFHPINKSAGEKLKDVIVSRYENVMRSNNDRYGETHG